MMVISCTSSAFSAIPDHYNTALVCHRWHFLACHLRLWLRVDRTIKSSLELGVFPSIDAAVSVAKPGDTILIAAGGVQITSNIQIKKPLCLIDQRQALELQIEKLKGAAQVMEHMGRDSETKKKMDEGLKEKEEELEDLEALTQTLVVKERKCNYELQDARKELIAGLKERKAIRANLGVKSVGLLDSKVFEKIAKEKCSKGEQPTEADKLQALCRQYIEDPK